MLDKDLAWLYEVETKRLNQAVKRNIERFPEDFMFQLTKEEFEKLMSENVTFKMGNKGLRVHSANSKEDENLKSQFVTSSEDDFLMSQFVTSKEDENLKSQFATSSWGGIRKMPYAFTEHGVAMLSSVLRSERAIAINIQIVRIFNKLRNMAIEHKSLRDELTELKNSFIKYAKGNNLELEEIYKQLDYLHDITKPTKIGFTN